MMERCTDIPIREHKIWTRSTQTNSQIIRQSHSVLQAVKALDRHFNAAGLSLLFLGSYDPKSDRPCTVLHSKFPKYLRRMCTRFDGHQGCPLVQMAIKSGEPFEALSLYLAGFDNFFSMRYLRELQNLGYDKIHVVPIRVSDTVLIYFVGTNEALFSGDTSRKLFEFLAQFTAGLSVKFNLYKLNRKRLRRSHKAISGVAFSEMDLKCLQWIADGKSVADIAAKMGLSEHTIVQIIKGVREKLNARSRCHAVAIATRLGFIDGRGV